MKRLTNDITAVPVNQINPDPTQPRKSFDGIEELAASIASNGLDQPITVRITGDNQFVIVTGERRYLAHKLAGLDTVDCIVVDGGTADDVFLAQMRENMSRQDMTTTEEMKAVKMAVDRGYTVGDLADGLGRSVNYVDELLALSTLPPEVVQALETGDLPKCIAISIAKGDPKEALKALNAAMKAKGQGVKQVRANLKALKNKSEGKPTNVDNNPAAKAEAKKLDYLMKTIKKFTGTDVRAATLARSKKADDLTLMVAQLRGIANNIETTLLETKAAKVA